MNAHRLNFIVIKFIEVSWIHSRKTAMFWNDRMFWKIKGMLPEVPLVMLGTSFNQRFVFMLAQMTAFSGSAFLQICGLDSELD